MDEFAGTYLFDPLGESVETSKRMVRTLAFVRPQHPVGTNSYCRYKLFLYGVAILYKLQRPLL